jgi:xanthine dehydrogenase YagR molybdenum-binding subunit
MSNRPAIGQPISRLEGQMKVTGTAKYSGEYNVPDLLYGYVVNSTIVKGEIIKINTESALELPGIIQIFTHENRPSLAWFNQQYADMDAPPGSPFRPLHDEKVKYYGQPIALVVAETFELARYAASIITVEYKEELFEMNINDHLEEARPPKAGLATALKPLPPKPKGDFETGFRAVLSWYRAPQSARIIYYHNRL